MKIRSGNADAVVVGGVESMSNTEFNVTIDIKWKIGCKKGMPRGTEIFPMRNALL